MYKIVAMCKTRLGNSCSSGVCGQNVFDTAELEDPETSLVYSRFAPIGFSFIRTLKKFLAGKYFADQSELKDTVVEKKLEKQQYHDGLYKLVSLWDKCCFVNYSIKLKVSKQTWHV